MLSVPLYFESVKDRSGLYKEKFASILALSVLHSNCEDLQDLLRLISNLMANPIHFENI